MIGTEILGLSNGRSVYIDGQEITIDDTQEILILMRFRLVLQYFEQALQAVEETKRLAMQAAVYARAAEEIAMIYAG